MSLKSIRNFFLFVILGLSICWIYLAEDGVSTRSIQLNTGESHALIIGIGKYDNRPALKTPPNDARELAGLLLGKYNFKKSNVVVLTDDSEEKPTRSAILGHLERFRRDLGENDNLLIYYSGHSLEDSQGETYWLPRDDSAASRDTLLSHTELCEKYFASEDFKVKNLLILANSLFRHKLLKYDPNSLTIYDLRYSERIVEKAMERSREVIFFGDQPWEGSPHTKGLSLFGYHLRNVLRANWAKVADIENLLFDEKILRNISKIVGTKLSRGRLVSPMDAGGQFVFYRTVAAPLVEAVDTLVTPEKGYVGDRFVFEIYTSIPATGVYLEIGGKRHLMSGRGRTWRLSMRMEKTGDLEYRMIPVNQEEKEGPPATGRVTALAVPAKPVHVLLAQVSPELGQIGNPFFFNATTDRPASRVLVNFNDRTFEMQGQDTEWKLEKVLDDAGTLSFEVAAINRDGVKGHPRNAVAVVKSPPVRIDRVEIDPDPPYAGEEFTFKAFADIPAKSVSVRIDDVTYPMNGSGREWFFTKKILETGKKSLVFSAINKEDKAGPEKSVELAVVKKPAPVADIAKVTVSPDKVYPDRPILVQVETSEPAREVSLTLDGEARSMKGEGTSWTFETSLGREGSFPYTAVAVNEDGRSGKPRDGAIAVAPEPAGTVDVLEVAVSPKTGFKGDEFQFSVRTGSPAAGVFLTIGEKRYEMSGSGESWSLKKRLEVSGAVSFSAVATNREGEQGASGFGQISVSEPLVDVVDIRVTPKKAWIGDEVTVVAKTDGEASEVILSMDKAPYAMSKVNASTWEYKIIPDFKEKSFEVSARNPESVSGKSKKGVIVAEKKPPAPGRVEAVLVDVAPPGKGYAGDEFIIKAKTAMPSRGATLILDGKKYPMEGSGVDWSYRLKIDRAGETPFSVIAENMEGKEGQPQAGSIFAEKPPAAPVDILKAGVTPQAGFAGDTFVFAARAQTGARGVTLSIGELKYEMSRDGEEWKLSRKIDDIGDLAIAMVARNEDEQPGAAFRTSLKIVSAENKYEDAGNGMVKNAVSGKVEDRFVDNRDGTATDRLTNLMWLMSPKLVSVKYDEAVEYCKQEHQGYAGWRLPTLEEWLAVVDPSKKDPALPPGHPFKRVPTRLGYWSKTQYRHFGPEYQYQVSLYYGKKGYLKKNDYGHAWPVRYAR